MSAPALAGRQIRSFLRAASACFGLGPVRK